MYLIVNFLLLGTPVLLENGVVETPFLSRQFCLLNTRYFSSLASNAVFTHHTSFLEIGGRNVRGKCMTSTHLCMYYFPISLDMIAVGFSQTYAMQMFLCGCGELCGTIRTHNRCSTAFGLM